MPHIARPVKPLADVNVIPMPDGGNEIVVCFMPDPDVLVGEGESRAVLALDASRSIKPMFGGGIFEAKPNYVQAVSRKIGEILCNISRNGKVNMLYWALGPGGDQTELIGEFDTNGCSSAEIIGPPKKNWGTGTQLLPPVRYIVESVGAQSDFTMGVIVTDGIIEDEAALTKYCLQVGQEIVDGKRSTIKLVLIGVGDEVDEDQFDRLNDMFESTPLKDKIDVWAAGIAADMREEADIVGVLFGELMDEELIVASSGRVLSGDQELKSFADGLPGKFRFVLPKGHTVVHGSHPGRRCHARHFRSPGLIPSYPQSDYRCPRMPHQDTIRLSVSKAPCYRRTCSPRSSAKSMCVPKGTSSMSMSRFASAIWKEPTPRIGKPPWRSMPARR